MPVDSIIDIQSIGKNYGEQSVLSDISLSLEQGDSLALLGHNGAGKTTLIKLMLGLIRPDSGRVSVLGADPSDGRSVSVRCRLGYLPENIAFYSSMTGHETLAFYSRLKRQPVNRCLGLLHQVGLSEDGNKRVGAYSKGMRQRLGLAQALIGRPEVLLLDEPTTGLDPVLRQHFYEILTELEAAGVCVVLSSHALTELEAHSTRIAILRRGRLLAFGTLQELRQQARLPIQIRLDTVPGQARKLVPHLPEHSRYEFINDHALNVSFAISHKVEMLQHLTRDTELVRDIEILPPSLNDLYLYFQNREENG